MNQKEKKKPSSFQSLFLSNLTKEKLIKNFREKLEREYAIQGEKQKVEEMLIEEMLKHIQSLSIKRRKNGLMLFFFMVQYSESFLKLSTKLFTVIQKCATGLQGIQEILSKPNSGQTMHELLQYRVLSREIMTRWAVKIQGQSPEALHFLQSQAKEQKKEENKKEEKEIGEKMERFKLFSMLVKNQEGNLKEYQAEIEENYGQMEEIQSLIKE